MNMPVTGLTLPSCEIIETYWNVNSNVLYSSCLCKSEIIETYWNVNVHRRHCDRCVYCEIIETYWNVNQDT